MSEKRTPLKELYFVSNPWLLSCSLRTRSVQASLVNRNIDLGECRFRPYSAVMKRYHDCSTMVLQNLRLRHFSMTHALKCLCAYMCVHVCVCVCARARVCVFCKWYLKNKNNKHDLVLSAVFLNTCLPCSWLSSSKLVKTSDRKLTRPCRVGRVPQLCWLVIELLTSCR